MKGATSNARSAGASQRSGAAAFGNTQRLAQYIEELRPEVLSAFEGQNLAGVPRPELAVRIGQIVTTATEADSQSLRHHASHDRN